MQPLTVTCCHCVNTTALIPAITVSRNEILEVRLSSNQLSGPLPGWLAALPVILLDASSNKLSGSLPAAALGSNMVLQELLLAGNRFSGSLSADTFRWALFVQWTALRKSGEAVAGWMSSPCMCCLLHPNFACADTFRWVML